MEDKKIYEEVLHIANMTYHMHSDYIPKNDYLKAVYDDLQQEQLANKN